LSVNFLNLKTLIAEGSIATCACSSTRNTRCQCYKIDKTQRSVSH
jgi:hypothetical protein